MTGHVLDNKDSKLEELFNNRGTEEKVLLTVKCDSRTTGMMDAGENQSLLDNNNDKAEVQKFPPNSDDSLYFGEEPVYIKCPYCQKYGWTRLKSAIGITTLLSCCFVNLFCWCGCCLVPCCRRSCRDLVHRCSDCGECVRVVERKCFGGFFN